MSLADRVSDAADRAIASPWAVPAYVATSAIGHALLPVDLVTLILSHFANLLLLLLLVARANRRASKKIEGEVDALADAHEGVDAEAIRRECDPARA